MLGLTVNTDRPVPDVMSAARRYFGGLGLGADATADGAMVFKGAGGFITLMLANQDGRTVVDMSTRQYEPALRTFARELA